MLGNINKEELYESDGCGEGVVALIVVFICIIKVPWFILYGLICFVTRLFHSLRLSRMIFKISRHLNVLHLYVVHQPIAYIANQLIHQYRRRPVLLHLSR